MIFALRSAGYFVLLIVFWFGLGRTLSRWLTAGDDTPARHALYGFAIATLAATLGYHWGVPLAVIFHVLAVLSLVGCVLQWRERFGSRLVAVVPIRHSDLLLLAAGAIVLFAPLATGGLQFALFHSNQYDALNYLQSAIVRLSYTQREISMAGPAEFLQNPLLVVAHWMAPIRPAIVDSYALTNGLSPGNLHQLSPAFLIAILLLAISAVAELAERLGASQFRAGLIGLATIGGFWGQYILDCDTWSLIGALPLALACFGTLDRLLDPTSTNRPPALGLAVPFAALLLVYPEQFCFLVPSAGALVFLCRGQCRLPDVKLTLLKAFVGTLLLAAPFSVNLWTFVERQLHSTLHANYTPLNWSWAVLFGATPQTAPFWLTGWQTLTGALGIYLPWLNQTPGSSLHPCFILGGTLGLCVIITATHAARRTLNQPTTKSGVPRLLTFTAVLLAQILVLGLLKGPWPAAKALSYSFPWITLLAFLPFAIPADQPMLRWPARLLLGLQLALACLRPFVAADKNGAGYPAPYPDADPALKNYRNWNVNDSPRLLATSRCVRIDVPDLWLEYYAMICTQAQGRVFVKTTPIREYYDMTPKTFGSQNIAVDTDSLIFAEYDPNAHTMALGFSMNGEIRWSGDRSRTITITHVTGPARLESWQGFLSWWNSAKMEIQADVAGPAFLELLIRRHPTLADVTRPVVVIEINGQPVQTLEIGAIKTGTLQVTRISLNLKIGQNFVTIRTDAPEDVPTVGFSNPRFVP